MAFFLQHAPSLVLLWCSGVYYQRRGIGGKHTTGSWSGRSPVTGGTVLYRNSTKRGAVVCFPPTTGPTTAPTTAPLLVLAGMPLLLGLKGQCHEIFISYFSLKTLWRRLKQFHELLLLQRYLITMFEVCVIDNAYCVLARFALCNPPPIFIFSKYCYWIC